MGAAADEGPDGAGFAGFIAGLEDRADDRLLAPRGARLFDAPLPYRGGPSLLFQRAETSSFFGREIGIMYMHAHLRYAQMLAHLGHAEAFLQALMQAHPITLRDRVKGASPRQANCYYSSSDAAFPDRYVAQAEYGRVLAGEVALDGGWRIYSSGPGIALGLVIGSLLGLRLEQGAGGGGVGGAGHGRVLRGRPGLAGPLLKARRERWAATRRCRRSGSCRGR